MSRTALATREPRTDKHMSAFLGKGTCRRPRRGWRHGRHLLGILMVMASSGHSMWGYRLYRVRSCNFARAPRVQVSLVHGLRLPAFVEIVLLSEALGSSTCPYFVSEDGL